jgi:hypothetical protein
VEYVAAVAVDAAVCVFLGGGAGALRTTADELNLMQGKSRRYMLMAG